MAYMSLKITQCTVMCTHKCTRQTHTHTYMHTCAQVYAYACLHTYCITICIIYMYVVLQDDFDNTSSQVILISKLMLAAILLQHPGEIFVTNLSLSKLESLSKLYFLNCWQNK